MNQLAGIGRCDYEPKPVSARGLRRCLRSWPMLSVCILTMAFLAHHPKARAQSVDGAVSPVLPPDAAELASRKPKRDWSAAATTLRIVLPPANEADQQVGSQSGQPLQIGFHRAIPSEFQGDLSSRMDWTALGDGSIVGAVSVTSPEARAVRAGIRAELGSGGEVRFFDGSSSTDEGAQDRARAEFPVMTRADFQGQRESRDGVVIHRRGRHDWNRSHAAFTGSPVRFLVQHRENLAHLRSDAAARARPETTPVLESRRCPVPQPECERPAGGGGTHPVREKWPHL